MQMRQTSRWFPVAGIGHARGRAGDPVTMEPGLSFAPVGIHPALPGLLWWTTSRAHERRKMKLALEMPIGFAPACGYATVNARVVGRAR